MKIFKKVLCIVMSYFVIVNAVLMPGFSIKAASATKDEINKKAPNLEAIPGEVIVKVKKTNDDSFLKVIKNYNPVVKSHDKQLYLISISNESVKTVIDILSKEKSVEFSEVNATARKNGNIGQYIPGDDFRNYDNILELWDSITDTTTEVKVAVLDTGLDTKHPALSSNILPGKNYINNTTDVTDDSGHGTQVSGIIAAKSDNVNIRGVAGNTNTKIIPLKVLDDKGEGTIFNIAQAIKYAADSGAQIINMSFSGKGYSETINEALDYAESKNCILISSSGDNEDNPDNLWPANSGKTLVVGSNYKCFSFGKYTDLLAQGEGATINYNGNFDQVSNVIGSSFAAAEISGVAALAKLKYKNLNAKQIENLIIKSSVKNYFNDIAVPRFNASLLADTVNDFISIREPYAYDYYKTNVNVKIDAINPSAMSSLKIYLNKSQTPITEINSTGASNYKYTIPISSLNEGTNTIIIKSYDKSGNEYTNTRYVNKATNEDNMINLNLKGLDGNPIPKNATIKLSKDNDYYNAACTITTDGSHATFFNTSKSDNYKIIVNYTEIFNGSVQPVIASMDVPGSGTYTVDCSKSKKLQLISKKADNTPLSSGILQIATGDLSPDLSLNYKNVFDSNGTCYAYVPAQGPYVFNVLSEQDGYFYSKKIADVSQINSVNFAVDDNVCRLDATNYYSNIISNETLSIWCMYIYDYGIQKFNIKNKSLYFTKGYYRIEDHSIIVTDGKTNEKINYKSNQSISLTENYYKLNFGQMKPYIKLNSKNCFEISIDDGNGNSISNNNESISYNLYDSQNNIISKDNYNIEELDGKEQLHFSDSVPEGSYFLEANVTLGMLGTSTSKKVEFYNDKSEAVPNNPSENVKVTIISPDSANKDCNWINAQIIDSSSGKVCFKAQTFNNELVINKKYFNATYNIKIQGENHNTLFAYNRSLPLLPSSSYTIDNSAGSAKKITFVADTSTPANLINNSSINLFTGFNLYKLKTPSTLMENVYLDSDSYKLALTDKLDNCYIYNDMTVSSSNICCIFSLLDAAKYTFKASSIKNVTSIIPTLSVNSGILLGDPFKNYDGYIEGIEINTINPNIKPEGSVSVAPKEIAALKDVRIVSLDDNNNYNYSYYFNMTGSKQYDIDFNNWNVNINDYQKNINVPDSFNLDYAIECGGYKLQDLRKYYVFDNGNIFKNTVIPLSLGIFDSSDKLCTVTKNYGYYDNKEKNNFVNIAHSTLPCNNLQNGNYYGKLMLPDNIIGYTPQKLNFTLSTQYLQKVKIMNPFNVSAPAINTMVNVSGNSTKTDAEGYIYLKKGDITDKNSISVFYKGSEGLAIYSPDSINANCDFTINKSVNSLKNILIKAKDNTNSVRLQNKTVQISKGGNNLFTELDENARANVYLQEGSYCLEVGDRPGSWEDNIYLKGNYSTTNGNTFEIDNVNVCKFVTPISDSSITLMNDNGSSGTSYKTCYYISPGININAKVTKNGLSFEKSFITEANKEITFKPGNILSLKLQNIQGDMIPGQKSYINYNFTDENSNNVSTFNDTNMYNQDENSVVAAVEFYKDDSKVASAPLISDYKGTCYVAPINLPSSGNMKLVISSPSYDKIESNYISYNIDTNNLCKVTVYGPDGKLCTNGSVRIDSQGSDINLDPSGSVYVKKCNTDSNNITIIGTDSTSGSTFIYNRNFTNIDSIYKADNIVKLTYNSNLIVSSDIYNCELCINNNSSNNLYDKQINSKEMNNLNGKNIYVDNGNYTFVLKAGQYILASNVDTSINTIINFDINNCGTITFKDTNNYSLKVGNVKSIYIYNDPLNTNNINKYCISTGLNVSYQFDDWENGISYINSYITEKNIDKSIGKGTKLNINVNPINTTLKPNDMLSFTLNVTDENGSKLSFNNYGENKPTIKVHFTDNYGNDIATANAEIYQDPDSIKYSVQLPPEAVGNVNFFVEVISKPFGSFKSSSTSITVDTSNYNKITVLDPYENPADGGNIVLGYNTIKIGSNGTAYISKNINSCNAAVNGKCKNSDEYFLYKLVYDSSQTTISKGEYEKLVNVSLLSSNNGSVSGSFYIKDPSKRCCIDKYFEKTFDNGANSQNPWSNYKNFNIWLPSYNYDLYFNNSYGNGNGTKTKYIMLQKYDQSSSKIVFDESNCCKVNVGINSLLSSDYYFFSYGMESEEFINKVDTLYISKNSKVTFRASTNGFDFSKEFNSGSKSNIFVNACVEPFELNFSLPRILLNNVNYNVQYSLKDSNGFNINCYYNNAYTTVFEKNGVKVAELTGTNITPTNIPSGDYDVYEVANIGQLGAIKSQAQKVYIADSSNTFKIYYLGKTSNPWNIYAYELLDNNGNVIFNGGVNNNDGIKIPKDKITYDKDYTIIISGYFNDGIHIYKKDIKFTNGTDDYTVQEDDSLVSVTGSTLKNSIINISQNGIKLTDNFSACGDGTYNIKMSPGTYDVNLKGTDSSTNSTYVLNRSFNVSSMDKTFDFSLNNLCKLNLNSGFNKIIAGKVILKSIGCKTEPTDIDLPTDTNLYVDKGVYSVTGKYVLKDKYQSIDITKTLDCSGTEASLAAINNLSLSAVLAGPSYNVGDSLSANIEAYNNTDKLNIFTPQEFTITAVEVMHGTKAIKKLINNMIPATLSGECNLRLTVHNDYIGDKQIIMPNVVINNPSCTAIGDINLDKIIDLYDLVMISRDMGKTKAASHDWDGRCNIENSSGDNVIDIKDIAAAAKNYNKKN